MSRTGSRLLQVNVYVHGHIFGPCRLVQPHLLTTQGDLGRGTFSDVVKAELLDEDTGARQTVAVKHINQAMARRAGEVLAFLREHHVLSAIKHPCDQAPGRPRVHLPCSRL
jgi:serine/threonine protein kinase